VVPLADSIVKRGFSCSRIVEIEEIPTVIIVKLDLLLQIEKMRVFQSL
jgi:hypothetical protein